MASKSLADLSRENLGGAAAPNLSLADLAAVALEAGEDLSLADLAYANLANAVVAP